MRWERKSLDLPFTIMASLLKAQSKIAAKSENGAVTSSNKRVKRDEDEVMDGLDGGEPPKKRRNKQRVLMLCSRGVTHRMRHLMNDLEALLPHVKKGL
jgi:ribosome biogenesis protein BRX1